MSDGFPPPGKVLTATCKTHRRYPDPDCIMCADAITFNRQNPGWGRKYVQAPDGGWEEYYRYDPVFSWFGLDAFMVPVLTLGGAGDQ
jgi:hypothetical protein